MYLCNCKGVTYAMVRENARAGVSGVDAYLKIWQNGRRCRQCNVCVRVVREIFCETDTNDEDNRK